ncbi:MAG TPA: rhomboid family intramembrane serine protease [Polyangiales bacterium]|nr:rhomboid family intramembrane serine protease [Polyangiales bacterium]
MFSFPPLTPVVKRLIITLFGAFVLELLLENFAGIPVIKTLAFDPIDLGPLSVLQLFSYVLIQNPREVMGLMIDLLFMWLIMSPFESAFGRRHTIELSLAGTLAGSLAAGLVAQLAPLPGWMLLGSHTIAYAGMTAMAQVMGSGRTILLFGVVPMSSKQLLLVLVGFSLLSYLATRDHLQLASSLGAMAAGIGYVKYMSRAPRPSARSKRPSTRFRVVRGGGGRDDSDRPKWLN